MMKKNDIKKKKISIDEVYLWSQINSLILCRQTDNNR